MDKETLSNYGWIVICVLVLAVMLALATPFGWWGVLIGFIIAMLLSFAKEQWLDDNFEWYDILAAFLGCIATVIIYSIILLL